ncbi:hypothetical protein HYH02_012579 [Chlamydomonas schloesseri]|uniref:Uncharacterized protein n=1 Tax=Chlamydomonas schloesseri TaxID=2026947 RepID=A0A835SXN3_9CHLO|nr:hypothetical protein HYH02_012579 [Chlamydomonas schloesseri]|eukprot:KAG2433651.1 hypothetical protein HYH02_012579 [Chlamydomonas schloesseri]
MRACTRDALHVLEREAAAGSSRNELLAGLGAAPHVVYARVRDKLKRMQRMAAHGKNPLDTGFDRMSTRGHVQRWPEWTKMAMVKLPGGCGGLQQLFEAIAADPAMAQYLDWRADPNCRAVPRWRQQLKKTLSRLPYFVNTGVRARDGTNCHVYRYDQGIEDALAQQHRGGRTQS